MLTTWSLANFKSYKNPPVFGLGPINILAGANSSGKSSLIQSILLLKQTLQYGAASRSLALNGPLLRLGSFTDIRNFAARDETVQIGMGFDFTSPRNHKQSEQRNELFHRHFRARRFGMESTQGIESLFLTLEYCQKARLSEPTAGTGSQSLNADLLRSSLSAQMSAKDGEERAVNLDLVRNESGGDDWGFAYEAKLDAVSLAEVFGDKPEPKLAGADILHFLPAIVGYEYNSSVHEAKRLAGQIFRNAEGLPGSKAPHVELPKSAVESINSWLIGKEAGTLLTTDGTATARDAQEALTPFIGVRSAVASALRISSKTGSANLSTELADLRLAVESNLIENEGETIGLDYGLPRLADTSIDFISEFFKQGVRYLGPLRDSPRPVYQPEALESTTDVGYRGEHTAAVLDLNANVQVAFHGPPSKNELEAYEGDEFPHRASLHDAVVLWLDYLGVAEDVKTTDAGVYGNRLQVSTDGASRLHDLTNVGVGVSQVLPIVVMALLARPGSLLIFEQPELHLHPKVQARLADFFLALAADGKQVLLETHSEYLVDRFRLRIALSPRTDFSEDVKIVFSYKELGETKLSEVEINEYGAIQNWPKDFFEQSQSDVANIIKASAEKRRRKRKGGAQSHDS